MNLPDVLQQFDRLDKSLPQFSDQLTSLLREREYEAHILNPQYGIWLIEYLDNALGTLDAAGLAYQTCIRELGRICDIRKELPQSCILESPHLILNEHPLASSIISGNVYEGLLNGSPVRVKRERTPAKKSAWKILYREIVERKYLIHPNLVPVLGITVEPFQFISPWASCKRLMEYIHDHPDVNRVALLSGIADGLDCLHSHDVAHGDLDESNIFVDDTGCPRITGYPALRWKPVRSTGSETLEDSWVYSKGDDVFSFAVVMFEVFATEPPFNPLNALTARINILEGEQPVRPVHPGLTDKLWALMDRCWHRDSPMRPGMSVVSKTLRSSNPSGHKPFFDHQDSVSAGPQTRPGSMDPETDRHPEPSTPILPRRWGSQSSRHSLSESNALSEDVSGSHPDGDDSHAPLPVLPQAPTHRFSREETVNEILDLTDQVASVALFGSIGVGKSFVAHTLLHHNRTQAKFGGNCHFMCCDNLTSSLEGFLELLSDAVRTDCTTDLAQLRSHVESSPPFILILDGTDFMLDPLAPEAEEILATIEEFGSYDHVCLVTTSRIYPEIHGFHRVEVPTLSEDDARDAFYGLCDLGRSPVVNDLIAELDFHPLSISLFASSVRKNGWDESMLLKAWGGGETSGLEKDYHQSLKGAMEPMLCSPTIQNLGATARTALEAITAYPSGVEECRLEIHFPGIVGIREAIDVLCKFSLIYREDGFVKMLSPFRFYFGMSMLRPAECTEVIRWDGNCNPAKAWLPIYTSGRPACPPPRKTLRLGTPSREKWIKRFRSMKSGLLAFFGRPVVLIISRNIKPNGESTKVPTSPGKMRGEEEPANTPPAAPKQQIPPALVVYEVD